MVGFFTQIFLFSFESQFVVILVMEGTLWWANWSKNAYVIEMVAHGVKI